MYDGIKRALGLSEKKTAPLKSKSDEPITDLKEQMDRWVKYYSELYLRETVVTDAALNSITQLLSQSWMSLTPSPPSKSLTRP